MDLNERRPHISEGVAPILGFDRSCYLLPVHLQLSFTPGSNVDFEPIRPEDTGQFLVGLPMGSLQGHGDRPVRVINLEPYYFSSGYDGPNAAL